MSATRILMSASAVVMGLFGLVGSFMPQELLARLGAPELPALVLLVQVTGALYLGFAFLDWMVRGNLIGGIYNRPVAVGNLLHFACAGLAMVTPLSRNPRSGALWALAITYGVLASGFGVILFRHPGGSKKPTRTP